MELVIRQLRDVSGRVSARGSTGRGGSHQVWARWLLFHRGRGRCGLARLDEHWTAGAVGWPEPSIVFARARTNVRLGAALLVRW